MKDIDEGVDGSIGEGELVEEADDRPVGSQFFSDFSDWNENLFRGRRFCCPVV